MNLCCSPLITFVAVLMILWETSNVVALRQSQLQKRVPYHINTNLTTDLPDFVEKQLKQGRNRLLESKSIQLINQETNNTFTIEVMQIAILELNLMLIPDNEVYKQNWLINFTIQQNDSYQELPLPEVLQRADIKKNQIFYLKITNVMDNQVTIKCTIEINSTTFLDNIKKLMMNLWIIEPERVSMKQQSPENEQIAFENQHYFYAVVLSDVFLANSLLPYNMPQNSGGEVLFDVIKLQQDFFPPRKLYSKQPYDQAFWINEETSTVAIPWLPFFSYCKEHGRHLILYHLLEDEEKCTLVSPEDTQIINAIPTNGRFFAISDKCDYTLECQFEEDVSGNSLRGEKWWESNMDLFYLTVNGQTLDSFIHNRNDKLSSMFSSQLASNNSQDLIPVFFHTLGKTEGYLPKQVVFQLRYHQVDQYTKYLIKGDVTMSDYVPADESGINSYKLQIKYSSINYLELINEFAFGMPIYLFLFSFLSLLSIMGIALFWFMNKTLTILVYTPLLRIREALSVAFLPVILGTFFGVLPFLMVIWFIYEIHQSNMFSIEAFFYQYDYSIYSQSIALKVKMGRSGVMLTVMGILFMKYGAGLFVYEPTPEEEQLIQKQLQRDNIQQQENNINYATSAAGQKDKNPSQVQLNQSDVMQKGEKKENSIPVTPINTTSKKIIIPNSKGGGEEPQQQQKILTNGIKRTSSIEEIANQNNENNNQHENNNGNNGSEEKQQSKNSIDQANNSQSGEDDEQGKIGTKLHHKKHHFLITMYITTGIFNIMLEFSFSEFFRTNLYVMLIVLFFFEAILNNILSKYMLKENLLLYPISAAQESIQFVMYMAADNLQFFIISYLIRLCIIIFFRVYVQPFLINLEFFMRRLMRWLAHKYPWIHSKEIFQEYLNPTAYEQHMHMYVQQQDHRLLGNGSQRSGISESKMIEQNLNQLLSIASKIHAIFLKPVLVLLIKVFAKETKYPEKYQINYIDFDYYLYFAVVIILPQIFIDIFIMNSLEMVHGFKLLDYLSYSRYRFRVRKTAWVPQNFQLDKFIHQSYRSLDNLKFSDQLYFMGTITATGLFLFTIGISVMIQNQYIVFTDPGLYPLSFFFIIIVVPIKNIIQFIWARIAFWKLKVKKESQPLASIDKFLNNQAEHIEKVMEQDQVKRHFVKCNKEWLIKNMHKYLTAENFFENDEYLIQIYKQLTEDEEKEKKEKRRQEMLEKKRLQQLKQQHLRRRDQQPTDEGNNGQPRLVDEQIQEPQYITKKTEMVTRKVIHFWYYQALQITYLQKLVQQIQQSKLDKVCRKCGIDIELRIVELIPFTRLMNLFRFKYAARPFSKYNWQAFYERNQKFMTLCLECEFTYKSKKLLNKKSMKDQLLSKVKQDEQEEFKLPKCPKAILLKWLLKAKSNILHRIHQQQFEKQ